MNNKRAGKSLSLSLSLSKLISLSLLLLLSFLIVPLTFANAQTQMPKAATVEVADFYLSAVDGEAPQENKDYVYDSTAATAQLFICSEKPMIIQNVEPLTPSSTPIIVQDLFSQYLKEVSLTLAGVNISNGSGPSFALANPTYNVNLLLADDTQNILRGTTGLEKMDSNTGQTGTLSIGVPQNSKGNGALIAEGTGGAGIGSVSSTSTSHIVINGGVITATGGNYGAGIGGGGGSRSAGLASHITINNGTVVATGGTYGAGIGAGGRGPDAIETEGHITINGGIVTATGGNGGAGIGGVMNVDVTYITINGGVVTATGGNYSAGIGGGFSRSAYKYITITGGTVTATGGTQAAGIGGSRAAGGAYITITGGTVKAIGGSQGGAAIGGGAGAESQSQSNSLDGDAVVFAVSGDGSTSALQGFSEQDMTQGITFIGTADYSTDPPTITWEDEGDMYGESVTITEDVAFPSSLTVKEEQKLVIAEDVTVTVPEGSKLVIEGDIENNGEVEGDIEPSGEGELKVLVTYDACGGEVAPESQEKACKTSDGVQPYGELPVPTKEGEHFDGWFTEAEGGSKVTSETLITNQNAHTLYAHWQSNPEPTPTPTPVPNPNFPNTWIPTTDGRWYFEDKNGNPVTDAWKEIEGKTYRFDNEGYALQEEWYFEDGQWYYFAPDCAMEVGSWQWLNGAWYAFNWDGTMCTGWTWDNDYVAWYYIRSDGSLVYGTWEWIDGAWYGFNWDGTMCTGWIWDNEFRGWYYCYSSGVMARNTWVHGYYVNNSGRWNR